MRVHSASIHNDVVLIDNIASDMTHFLGITHITQSLSVCFNLTLTELYAPHLSYIGNSLTFSSNRDLNKIHLPALEQVSWFSLSNATALQLLLAPNLSYITHGLYISNAPQLQSLGISESCIASSNMTLVDTPFLGSKPFGVPA